MTITHVSRATSRPEAHTVAFNPMSIAVDGENPESVLYYIVENNSDYYGERFPVGSVVIRYCNGYERFPPSINKAFDVHNDKWGSTTGSPRLYEGMDFLVIPPGHHFHEPALAAAKKAPQTTHIINL